MSGINAFFRDALGAPVANVRWSWGSVDHERRRVYLRVWSDELLPPGDKREIQVLRKAQDRSRPGWNERVRHLEFIRAGYQAFGVLCERADRASSVIRQFDAESLLVLATLSETSEVIRAGIVGNVATAELAPAAHSALALAADLERIAEEPVPATTRAALVEARLGQGRYRRQLSARWRGACAVTGCTVQAALRASHCKPWRDCDNRERLDPHNGLLLIATLDALFDAGLIAFESDGAMRVSAALSAGECTLLGIPAPLRRKPDAALSAYLKHHRERIYLDRLA